MASDPKRTPADNNPARYVQLHDLEESDGTKQFSTVPEIPREELHVFLRRGEGGPVSLPVRAKKTVEDTAMMVPPMAPDTKSTLSASRISFNNESVTFF